MDFLNKEVKKQISEKLDILDEQTISNLLRIS